MIKTPDSDEALFWAVYETENFAELYEVACAIGVRLRSYTHKRMVEVIEYDIWPPDAQETRVMGALHKARSDAFVLVERTLAER